MGTKFQSKIFTQRLALLETREELIEKADDDGVDADAFSFGPVFELGTGLGSNVEELGIGKIHASLAGLLNIDFILIDMA